ncbi:MAG: prepilin-type N-terminal cleavage/methylation domain-containing protein [Sphingomonadaceae bacterium]|nr:prepilin-type N-terminal cleavage/methylation domain-containing protein [Sphingomonadaceae bacterium]
MPTSVTGNSARSTRYRHSREGEDPSRVSERGFTLVELMVVIAIIGLASAAVVLAIPNSQGEVRREAESLAARTLAARDDAILESRDMAVTIDATGYAVERRRRGAWSPATDRAFAPVRWNAGTTAMFGDRPLRAVFDTTGAAAEPMIVVLTNGGARASVTISGDGAIRVGA